MALYRFAQSLLLLGLICNALALVALAEEESWESFEGRIVYDIRNEGVPWSYTLWLKGDLWRGELRQGEQIYEVKIGAFGDPRAYAINDASKTYSPIRSGGRSGGKGGGKPGGRPPENAEGGGQPEGREQIDLSKYVKSTDEVADLLGYQALRSVIKGKGKKLDVWLCDGLGPFDANALPRFQTFEDKGKTLGPFWRQQAGFPLKLEERGSDSENGFSMLVASIESSEIDEALVVLPEDYIFQMSARGGGPGGGGQGGQRGGPGGGGGRGPGGGGGR